MLHCRIIFIVVLFGFVNADDSAKAAEDEVSAFAPPSRMGYFYDIIKDKIYTNYQFGVLVHPNVRQCYYQAADNSTTILFAFETLSTKGFASSNLVSVSVVYLGEKIETLESFQEVKCGNHTLEVEKTGLYAVCIDTKRSRGPLTYVQITIDIWRGRSLSKIHEDIKEENDTMYNIYDGLYGVTKSLLDIKSSIFHSRSIVRSDYMLTTSNLDMINNYSVTYIVLITIVCFVQLHVVKKMFGLPKSIVV